MRAHKKQRRAELLKSIGAHALFLCFICDVDDNDCWIEIFEFVAMHDKFAANSDCAVIRADFDRSDGWPEHCW